MRSLFCIVPFVAPLFLAFSCNGASNYAGHIPYSKWMVESVIARGEGVRAADGLLSEIQKGFFQEALRAAIKHFEHTDSAHTWNTYHRQSLEYGLEDFINATADSLAPLDRLCAGVSILQSKIRTETSQKVLLALQKSLDLQNRNDNGGFWYFTDPPPPFETYGNLSYIDGVYGLVPFMTLFGQKHPTNPSISIKTALDQLEALYSHVRHEPTGLILHGYDASRRAPWADPVTGASPMVWSRSMAWYMIGLLNALEIAASDVQLRKSADYSRMLTIFGELATANLKAVLKSVHQTGKYGVWQVVDHPGAQDNFLEASASAMMTFVLAKGLRLGFLAEVSAGEMLVLQQPSHPLPETQGARKRVESIVRGMFDELLRSFVVVNKKSQLEFHGTSAMSSLHVDKPDYHYYTSRPLLNDSLIGESAFILASLEIERLG